MGLGGPMVGVCPTRVGLGVLLWVWAVPLWVWGFQCRCVPHTCGSGGPSMGLGVPLWV